MFGIFKCIEGAATKRLGTPQTKLVLPTSLLQGPTLVGFKVLKIFEVYPARCRTSLTLCKAKATWAHWRMENVARSIHVLCQTVNLATIGILSNNVPPASRWISPAVPESKGNMPGDSMLEKTGMGELWEGGDSHWSSHPLWSNMSGAEVLLGWEIPAVKRCGAISVIFSCCWELKLLLSLMIETFS